MHIQKKDPGNIMLRWALVCGGCLCVVAGVAGLFLPLLPSVPLLLLAAFCFARSSEKFHTWLLEHNHLGPLIRHYLEGSGIPARARWTAIGMVGVSFSTSIFFFANALWLKLALAAIAVGITVYLLRLPARQVGLVAENRGNNDRSA